VHLSNEVLHELGSLDAEAASKRRDLVRVYCRFIEAVVAFNPDRRLRRERRMSLRSDWRKAADFLRGRISALEERLDHEFHRMHLPCSFYGLVLLINPKFNWLFGTAYMRDWLVTSVLASHIDIAMGKVDAAAVARFESLQKAWDRVDKGCLRKSEVDVQALTFLRKEFLYRKLILPSCDQSEKEGELVAKLFAPVRRSLANDNSIEFEKALVKAKKFRAQRIREARDRSRAKSSATRSWNTVFGAGTEEANLPTELAFYGIMCALASQTHMRHDDELSRAFGAVGYGGDIKNFQKLLNKSFVPWRRRKPWSSKVGVRSPSNK